MILKLALMSKKIIKLTFDNCFPINFLPLKCLTEVMLHWHLQLTFIWNCWWHIPRQFILSLHHRYLDRSEWATHFRLQKICQILFVVFSHCVISYPVLYCHFQQVFERLLNSRLLLLYTPTKKLSIQLVLLHCINIFIIKRNKIPR